MKERDILLGILLITSFILFVLPNVSAATITEDCRLEVTCSGGFTEVANASFESNAHLSVSSSSSFPAKLCCNQTITRNTYGQENMFSISDAGGGQGHAGDNETFNTKVAGSWTQCSLESSCRSDQACLVEVGTAGANQGHASSCGDSTSNDRICCCPYGTYFDGDLGQCRNRFAGVDIVSFEADPNTAGTGDST